jgi:3-deoxy-D-manno-octulosonate 8-phosphate phosphatase (KDO 8-P phosphatase)
VLQGVKRKLDVFEELCARLDCPPDQMAYAGDDLLDLPVMRRVALAIAVADARPEVRARAHYVTAAPGGHGAVREIAELIIKARGRWPEITARYFA